MAAAVVVACFRETALKVGDDADPGPAMGSGRGAVPAIAGVVSSRAGSILSCGVCRPSRMLARSLGTVRCTVHRSDPFGRKCSNLCTCGTRHADGMDRPRSPHTSGTPWSPSHTTLHQREDVTDHCIVRRLRESWPEWLWHWSRPSVSQPPS